MRWAVIPARMASTRLPGKMLTDVGGVPLVVCTWRSVVASGLFDRVTIAAADAEIVEIARAHGAEVLRTGPAPSGTHRVSWVVDDHSVVVNVQGDMPLVGSEALGAAPRRAGDRWGFQPPLGA